MQLFESIGFPLDTLSPGHSKLPHFFLEEPKEALHTLSHIAITLFSP